MTGDCNKDLVMRSYNFVENYKPEGSVPYGFKIAWLLVVSRYSRPKDRKSRFR